MNSNLIKLRYFNLLKGISLLIIVWIIYVNERLRINNFSYLISGSLIIASLIHLGTAISNEKKSTESSITVIVGLIVILASVLVSIILSDYYNYYANYAIFSFWLLIQSLFMMSYLTLLFKLKNKHFKILALLSAIVFYFTISHYIGGRVSNRLYFTILPFTIVGLSNIYIFFIFKGIQQTGNE